MPIDIEATLTRIEWDAAASRTVFFGHQSIGNNIIDGLKQLAASHNWTPIRVVAVNAGGASTGAALLHAEIGQNGDPSSKLRAFRDALEGGVGSQVDAAVLKFCFWDIRHHTDIDAVFHEYRQTMTALAERFPQLTIVHTTVPLVVEDNDWRARTRRLLGMGVPTDADNRAREALNRKIRETYGSRGPVFDVAALEEEGAAASAGSPIPHLSQAMSSDGAHLNDKGRRVVASGFVKTLAALPNGSPNGGPR